MSKRRGKRGPAAAWVEFHAELSKAAPHLSAWFDDVDDFGELRIKARADGTVLSIAKGYGSDGGPIVCFGVGYDVAASLMAIDKTIQGGNWRVDKPWQPNRKEG